MCGTSIVARITFRLKENSLVSPNVCANLRLGFTVAISLIGKREAIATTGLR